MAKAKRKKIAEEAREALKKKVAASFEDGATRALDLEALFAAEEVVAKSYSHGGTRVLHAEEMKDLDGKDHEAELKDSLTAKSKKEAAKEKDKKLAEALGMDDGSAPDIHPDDAALFSSDSTPPWIRSSWPR